MPGVLRMYQFENTCVYKKVYIKNAFFLHFAKFCGARFLSREQFGGNLVIFFCGFCFCVAQSSLCICLVVVVFLCCFVVCFVVVCFVVVCFIFACFVVVCCVLLLLLLLVLPLYTFLTFYFSFFILLLLLPHQRSR